MLYSDFSRNPYLTLGLKRNPFVLEGSSALPNSLWLDRGWSTPPPAQAKRLVQLIGVKGAGKTSHLRHWRSHTGGPYCYYPPGLGRIKLPPTGLLKPLAAGEVLYWDECDRIPLPLLITAFTIAAKHRRTVAAGTHQDLGWAARIAGLAVKTIVLKPFSAEMLIAWAEQRLRAVCIPDRPCLLRLSKAKAEKIAIAARGSWRESADTLHVWAAMQAQKKLKETANLEGRA